MSIERRLLKRAGAMTALVLMVAPVLVACGGEPTATPAPAATATTAAAQPTATQAASAEATAATAPRQQSELAAGWNKIDPGGNTICARGTPYSFWARQGTVNKLLIYFQGGGGCWNYDTCKPGSGYFNDKLPQSSSPVDLGMLALTEPSNPFKDYSIVYVPYCTGDVHMGSYTQTYTSTTGSTVTIHHNGYINSSTAVEWAYSHISSPESVFVTGCSAGSIGSIVFAPYVIKHYNQARVVQMGDSEAYISDHAMDLQTDWHAHDNFPNWIPAVANIKPGNFTMSGFYSAIAQYYPNNIFSQYNTAHDFVQQRYYFADALPGTPAPWEEAFRQGLAEIHSAAPNFRSYTAGGNEHCITPDPRFYTETTEGVPFRDWVNSLANATPVPNVGN